VEQSKPISTSKWDRNDTLETWDFHRAWSALQEAYGVARFEWNLIAFACGIALYFWLPFEPGSVGVGLLLGSLATLLILCQIFWNLNVIFLTITFCLVGIVNGIWHTNAVSSPILPAYHKSYMVEGWIEKSARSKNMEQIYIRVDQIEGLGLGQTPKRVRVRLKPGVFNPGDAVRVKAVLNQPPIPAIAGGYDPARRAFFQQIGGYGFAVGTPEIIELRLQSSSTRMKRRLVRFRYAMSSHIQARAPPATAGLQATLLTGDRSAIPENQENALRDAGLAHLLAISGLHMGLLAGGAYYFASLLFAMIGPWARRYDMRKWAALIGALFATGYLLLSGASVSTQRAFIMAIIVFAAIMLDRRAVSMRSVAVAAAITLLLHPENLLNAGFHMSFAATAALVAVYRFWADRRDIYKENFRRTGIVQRFWRGFLGLSVTSFVAGTATAGFAALHFHRVAKYGFAGNLAAMPVFTFLAMPAGFLAVLLMPFGLDAYCLKIMGAGLDYILRVSVWISEKEGAIAYLKGANSTVISIFGFGFALLCLGPKPVRLLGASLAILSFGMWANIVKPDMRVSQDGRVAFWDQSGEVLLVDRSRADTFGRLQFLEKSGIPTARIEKFTDSTVPCDALGCRYKLKGKTISVLYEPEGVLDACADSDLVILTQRIAGPVAKWRCNALLVDTRNLSKNGALDVAVHNGKITLTTANPAQRQARPWGG
jgi:competence protein ComEC